MQQAWKDLENSLKTGDLDGAKKAYATITQMQQQMTSQPGNPPGSAQFKSDMDALGKALDSGNLSDAQQAFASLKNDIKNHPHPAMQKSNSSSSTDSEILQLLQQLDSSSSGSSASSAASNSSSRQGISVKA
jgi:soluble cytochrome b562